jgi:hypothetical protein
MRLRSIMSFVLVTGCVPMQSSSTTTPANATAAAEAPAAPAAPILPPVAAITLQPSGLAMLDLETRNATYLDFAFDVTAAELTEVWIRPFAGKGTDSEGSAVSTRIIELCDPSGERSTCENVHASGEIIANVMGTRRVKLHFEHGTAPKRITVQLVTNRKQLAWTDLVIGAPAPDAPVARRDLTRFGIPDYWIRSSWTKARTAFTKLPRTFVIYATRNIDGVMEGQRREIASGEPLLLIAGGFVLRANGELVALRLGQGIHLDMVASAAAPPTIVMPKAWADTDGGRSDVSMYDYPYGDDTAEFSGLTVPELDAFLKTREPVKACIGRELAKRGSGFGYDVALYKKDGTIKKVQSLTSYIEEQVYRTCAVAKLDKQRVQLRTALRARTLEEIQATLASP